MVRIHHQRHPLSPLPSCLLTGLLAVLTALWAPPSQAQALAPPLMQSLPAVTRLPAAAEPPAMPSEAGRAAAAEAAKAARATTATWPLPGRDTPPEPPPEPSEFERLAQAANGGKPVARLGARLRRIDGPAAHLETPARVPGHYVVQVGDELSVALWGSVDAQWQLRVDRAGRITLPRVGPVAVAGAQAQALDGLLRARLERVFKGFELSAAVTDVMPVRVHLSGFVERPGDYVVPGLSTISSALAQAQGPAAGGSYRRIQLLRQGAPAISFDLYDILRDGNRRNDQLLQPDDVLNVLPAGPQVAVLGSVNRVAVFEFLPGETVADALALAGGFSSVADTATVLVERLRERAGLGAVALAMPQDSRTPLADGDLLRVRSQAAAAVASQWKNKRVLVEGEVRQPGEYLLPANATLADAIAAAGGASPSAFLFGATLRRESVRITQEQNYDRALREMELALTRNASSRSGSGSGSNDERAADTEASIRQTIARLRSSRPEGRMLLDVGPQAQALPAIALEDGDQLVLPAANQSVGVFGSVYNTGSFSHDSGRSLGHYIQRAGGPTAGADYGAAFVVRANGSVLSAAQGGFWSRSRDFETLPALPGDTVFVPEDLFRGTWVQGAKDWTQILYQLGVGLAALRTIR